MKRIRIDDDAAEKLDAMVEDFDQTQVGIASEAIRWFYHGQLNCEDSILTEDGDEEAEPSP
jgi:predicted transcriptional regulator